MIIQTAGETGLILRFRDVDEATHQLILAALKNFGEFKEEKFDSIGPVMGAEMTRRALWALGAALVAIVFYIAWAFRRVSRPVSSWKYGVVAILALLHDILIPTGIFALLGKYKGVEIDLFFVGALLTILGFSVHDTIVVFDRIRENLYKLKTSSSRSGIVPIPSSGEPYEITIDRSIKETIVRSVNTSLTTLLALLAIFFWGGVTVKYLALALILGITFGTYSSIFVASPLLVVWHRWTGKT